ncbi:hypothetical protein TcasGA2_TC013961 [Tribolium castaneum]|uniref:Uncharacterized protein n=1 Tax=Tribolium castaneum TaxID=7070 RepID=D6WNS2_TRICA|nr:hypothetical protein TcasGA2_TC013961 [Tribolium castaneum]
MAGDYHVNNAVDGPSQAAASDTYINARWIRSKIKSVLINIRQYAEKYYLELSICVHFIFFRTLRTRLKIQKIPVTVIVINPAGRQGGSRPCYRSDPASPAAALLLFHSLSLCIACYDRRRALVYSHELISATRQMGYINFAFYMF